jgi:hypothetical protein
MSVELEPKKFDDEKEMTEKQQTIEALNAKVKSLSVELNQRKPVDKELKAD